MIEDFGRQIQNLLDLHLNVMRTGGCPEYPYWSDKFESAKKEIIEYVTKSPKIAGIECDPIYVESLEKTVIRLMDALKFHPISELVESDKVEGNLIEFYFEAGDIEVLEYSMQYGLFTNHETRSDKHATHFRRIPSLIKQEQK